jgi:hypothetical protein
MHVYGVQGKGQPQRYAHLSSDGDHLCESSSTEPRTGKELRTLTAEYFNDAAVNEGYILLANEKPQVKEGELPMDVLSKTQINYLRSDIKVFLNRHESEVSDFHSNMLVTMLVRACSFFFD